MPKKQPAKAKATKKVSTAKKTIAKSNKKTPQKKASPSKRTPKTKAEQEQRGDIKTSNHIGAPIGGGKFGEVVLCPGDPLRAKFIAEKYLKDPE